MITTARIQKLIDETNEAIRSLHSLPVTAPLGADKPFAGRIARNFATICRLEDKVAADSPEGEMIDEYIANWWANMESIRTEVQK